MCDTLKTVSDREVLPPSANRQLLQLLRFFCSVFSAERRVLAGEKGGIQDSRIRTDLGLIAARLGCDR